MDQHGEKEEHSSQVPRDQRRTKVDYDAAGEGGNHADQRDGGHEEAEQVLVKEVEAEVEVVVGAGVRGGSEGESSPAPLLARPCSLLQFLLRACAGCLGLHYYGYCSGERPVSGYFYMQKVISTGVWAVRRRRRPPAAPDRPREGPGGNGGDHH